MKAVTLSGFGDVNVLKVDEVPEPECGPSEVLIASHSSGLNGADLLQRKGFYPPPQGASPLLGLEVAGTLKALGKDVSGWKKGDPVMALLAGGGYAETVAVRHDQIMRVPKALNLTDAGGVVEVFVTAYLELVELGRLHRGERVLIHAGASGVGTAAIQIAKSIGAEIWVTAGSDEKLAFCKELGAHLGINYKTEDFAERIKVDTAGEGVHCILDLVGASHFAGNIKSLSFDGTLLLVGLSGGAKTELDMRQVLGKRISIIGSTLRSRALDDKARLIKNFWAFAEAKFESGEFHPVIDKIYPAAEVKDAHLYMEAGKNKGKILLRWS